MDIDSPSFNKSNNGSPASLTSNQTDSPLALLRNKKQQQQQQQQQLFDTSTPFTLNGQSSIRNRPHTHQRSNSLKRPFTLSPSNNQNIQYSNSPNFSNLTADFSQNFHVNSNNPKIVSNPKKNLINIDDFCDDYDSTMNNDKNKENMKTNLFSHKFFDLNNSSTADVPNSGSRKSLSLNNLRPKHLKVHTPNSSISSISSNSSIFSSSMANTSANSSSISNTSSSSTSTKHNGSFPFNFHSRSSSSSNSSSTSASINGSSSSLFKNHLRSKSSSLMTSFAFKTNVDGSALPQNSSSNIFEDSFARQNQNQNQSQSQSRSQSANIFSMTPNSQFKTMSLDLLAIPTPERDSIGQAPMEEDEEVSPETKSVLNKSNETLLTSTLNSKSNLSLLRSLSKNNESSYSLSSSMGSDEDEKDEDEEEEEDDDEEDVIDKLNKSKSIYKNSNSTGNLLPYKKSIFDNSDMLENDIIDEDDEQDISQGSIGSPLQKKQSLKTNGIDLFRTTTSTGTSTNNNNDLSRMMLQRTTSMVATSNKKEFDHFQLPSHLNSSNKGSSLFQSKNSKRNLKITANFEFSKTNQSSHSVGAGSGTENLNRSVTSINGFNFPLRSLNNGPVSSGSTSQLTSNINGLSFKSPIEFESKDGRDDGKVATNRSTNSLNFHHPMIKSAVDSTIAEEEGDEDEDNSGNSNDNSGIFGQGNLILPFTKIKTFKVDNGTLPRIDVDTFFEILENFKTDKCNESGLFYDSFKELVIIDCRFEYEFKGGHIEGAINVSSKKELEDLLFPMDQETGNIELLNTKPVDFTNTNRKLIIFHCEFSSHRGPLMANNLRNWDRFINKSSYPNLYYPDIVILEGGYKKFFEKFGNEYCYPKKYVEMDDPNFKADCERGLYLLRQDSKMNLSNKSNSNLVGGGGSGGNTNNGAPLRRCFTTTGTNQELSKNLFFGKNNKSLFNLPQQQPQQNPSTNIFERKLSSNIFEESSKSNDIFAKFKKNSMSGFGFPNSNSDDNDNVDNDEDDDRLDFLFEESPVVQKTVNLKLSQSREMNKLDEEVTNNDVFKQPSMIKPQSSSTAFGSKYKSMHFRSKTMTSINLHRRMNSNNTVKSNSNSSTNTTTSVSSTHGRTHSTASSNVSAFLASPPHFLKMKVHQDTPIKK